MKIDGNFWSELASVSSTNAKKSSVTAVEAEMIINRLFELLNEMPVAKSFALLNDFIAAKAEHGANLKVALDLVSKQLDTKETKITRPKVGSVISKFFMVLHYFPFDEAFAICSELYMANSNDDEEDQEQPETAADPDTASEEADEVQTVESAKK